MLRAARQDRAACQRPRPPSTHAGQTALAGGRPEAHHGDDLGQALDEVKVDRAQAVRRDEVERDVHARVLLQGQRALRTRRRRARSERGQRTQ